MFLKSVKILVFFRLSQGLILRYLSAKSYWPMVFCGSGICGQCIGFVARFLP